MNIDLTGRIAFITGGHGGIGRAICERFASSGARVESPSSRELNLESESEIDDYFNRAKFKPDIVVHSAAINELAGIEELESESLRKLFNINLFSFMSILKNAVPSMKAKNFGRIIGISSLYGIISRERRIPYSSSKHALTGFIKSLALETAKNNILVNGVAPGWVLTKMTRKNLSSSEIENISQNIPTGRMQEASEIADLCCFLCSSLNQSITGQIIPVDGGFLCK